MYKFLVVIESTESGYSAYSPDLPGCVATGKTREEVEKKEKLTIINEYYKKPLETLKKFGLE